jgi:hypothetical protein
MPPGNSTGAVAIYDPVHCGVAAKGTGDPLVRRWRSGQHVLRAADLGTNATTHGRHDHDRPQLFPASTPRSYDDGGTGRSDCRYRATRGTATAVTTTTAGTAVRWPQGGHTWAPLRPRIRRPDGCSAPAPRTSAIFATSSPGRRTSAPRHNAGLHAAVRNSSSGQFEFYLAPDRGGACRRDDEISLDRATPITHSKPPSHAVSDQRPRLQRRRTPPPSHTPRRRARRTQPRQPAT